MGLALMAAIVAATAAADVRLRATAADVPRRAAELLTEADRRTAEGPRTAADRRTEVAAADMGGNTALDSFPA